MGYKKFILPFIASVLLLSFVLNYPTSQTQRIPITAEGLVDQKGDIMLDTSDKTRPTNVSLTTSITSAVQLTTTTTIVKSDKNTIYKLSPEPYKHYVVPNLVHFVWFTRRRRPLEFTEMLSILSAHKYQRPEMLYIHCNIIPVGTWWLELKSKADVKLIHREIPLAIGHYNISDLDHATEVTKLEILIEYGGIVLDVDVIVLNSLDPLRFYNFTMGKEKAPKLSSSIVISRKDSEFLHRWYRGYREDYKSSLWDYNCCTVPYKLAHYHVDWIHIEPFKLTTPDWMDRHLLYVFSNSNLIISWREFYAVHLMFHNGEGRIYSPEYIKALRNLVGKILRFVYYGSEDELSEFVPWVYYSKHPIIYKSENNSTSVKTV